MQVFNMENADGPVTATAMSSWKRSHVSFFPQRSRPCLSPSISTPKFSTLPGTGDTGLVTTPWQWLGLLRGTGLHKAYTSHTWSWFCGGTTETTGKYSGLKSILQAKLYILPEGCWFPEGTGLFCFNQAPNKHWQTKQIKYITSSQFQIIPQRENTVLTGLALYFFRGQEVIAVCNSAFN